MRLYFIRIFPMLFAISIIYHLQLIDRIEEVPYTEINWRKDLQNKGTLYQQGEALFRQYCSACHPHEVKHQMPASDLKGISDRWDAYPSQDLIRFIRFPDSLRHELHPRVLELSKTGIGKVGFPDLSNRQVESIIRFLDQGQ